MNSLFTGEPSERTVEGQSKEDLVRSRFVDSVDILQKMKAIQLRKNQMGHVPHTYSVLKEQKHKEGNRFRQSEDTAKEEGIPARRSLSLTLQKRKARCSGHSGAGQVEPTNSQREKVQAKE
jgi:hypothetical protein